jgi:hypothetical protein
MGMPEMDYQPEGKKDELDIARENSERRNCESLAALLRTTGDQVVELYGVWDGDFAKRRRLPKRFRLPAWLMQGFVFKSKASLEFSSNRKS